MGVTGDMPYCSARALLVRMPVRGGDLRGRRWTTCRLEMCVVLLFEVVSAGFRVPANI